MIVNIEESNQHAIPIEENKGNVTKKSTNTVIKKIDALIDGIYTAFLVLMLNYLAGVLIPDEKNNLQANTNTHIGNENNGKQSIKGEIELDTRINEAKVKDSNPINNKDTFNNSKNNILPKEQIKVETNIDLVNTNNTKTNILLNSKQIIANVNAISQSKKNLNEIKIEKKPETTNIEPKDVFEDQPDNKSSQKPINKFQEKLNKLKKNQIPEAKAKTVNLVIESPIKDNEEVDVVNEIEKNNDFDENSSSIYT